MSKSHVARMGLELLGNSAPPPVPFPSERLLVSTTAQNIGAGNVLGRWLGEGELKIE